MTNELPEEISACIFPKDAFFKFPAPNADEFIAALEKHPKVISNDDPEFEWGKLFSGSDKVALDENVWGEYLIPSIDRFSSMIGGDLEWSVQHCWMNLYKKGDYQEPHDHTGYQDVNLCCVFVANSGKDFSEFSFYDVHHGRLGPFWASVFDSKGVLSFNESAINAGDIIFFPPYTFHAVTPHKSDIIRTTFSANITIHNFKIESKNFEMA